jgi:transcriptional regulator with XRE-family HTH domain
MDIVPNDEVVYESFSPPVSWNAAYSLQRARFGPKEKAEYVFHPGEELVIPIQGEITHHFFWTPGGRMPERVLRNTPPSEPSIVRINPQIPHHAWSTKGDASAWLILRHATNSPVAVVIDREAGSLALQHSATPWPAPVRDQEVPSTFHAPIRHRVTADDLRKPGAYALIAWGISDLIRDTRQKAGFTTTDLANQIGIDPSSLSRLEEAKANVSIEMLAKVCRGLRIGMAERMDSGSWIYQREKIETKGSVQSGAMLPVPPSAHTMHPYLSRLAEGEQRAASTFRGEDPNQTASWILLKGRILLDLPPTLGGKSLIVESGNVMHFRERGDVQLKALSDSTIVHIVHSRLCGCKPTASTTLM